MTKTSLNVSGIVQKLAVLKTETFDMQWDYYSDHCQQLNLPNAFYFEEDDKDDYEGLGNILEELDVNNKYYNMHQSYPLGHSTLSKLNIKKALALSANNINIKITTDIYGSRNRNNENLA
ncbi:hypothetical protein HELRODRAFT_166086 [Helobdella robusta]|uniref:Uncharacterized protein n=1 Tax=Helobdella robusta TaxID=6412 RepID=T1EXQ6_HELRO|nr:hypothetical protein HELRODRAFT_166086 [Helobdella robusta]ESN90420.1 hypothetical protein HELRODRAFT_166086 [Helobdella robusta]